jgi:hypothetical protein
MRNYGKRPESDFPLTAATWKVIPLTIGLFAKRATNYLDRDERKWIMENSV